MNKERVKGMVLEVFEKISGYKMEDLKLDDDLREDLGMDELEFAQIAIELEDQFGVEIGEGWSVRLVTVADLLESVGILAA